MRATDRTLLEWLGEEGVAAVLRHSLDRPSLIRLANARRVNVPGMRNRSVPVDKLAAALASKFAKEEASRRVLLSALDTANRRLIEEWKQQGDAEALAKVEEEKVTGGAAARLLYVMCRDRRDGVGVEQARGLLARSRPAQRREESSRDAAESSEGDTRGLQAVASERDGLAEQLAAAAQEAERSRRRERHLQEELAQRKFELNNLRLQAARGKAEQERLEKEIRALQQKFEESAARKKGTGLEELLARIAQLHDQQRKTVSAVEKLVSQASGETRAIEKITAAVKTTEELKRGLGELRREVAQMQERAPESLEKLLQETAALREQVAGLRASPRRTAKARPERSGEQVERAGLFVDVQNVFYGARQQNARLDFEALLQTVSRGRRMIRAAAYVVESRDIDQSGFISLLQQKGYEVRRKPLKVRADGSQKGDWDMEMALDILDVCDALDVLILVTGDGDFTALVHRVKARGVQVEVYSFPRNTAQQLRETATRFVPIDRRLLIKLPKDAPAHGSAEETPAS